MRCEDYVDAWRAEKGYGVKARVLNSTSPEDEREVLTIGLVGISTRPTGRTESYFSSRLIRRSA